MTDLDSEVMAVFRMHHGVASGPMLTHAGLGRNARRRLVDAAVLEPVHKRVYRIASAPATLESRCAALCMAHPRVFVTGPSAGRLTGLRRMGPDSRIHLAVPHGCNLGPIPGVVLRQTTVVDPEHVQTRRDGIRLASPPRLAFDLAADLCSSDHASVVEQILAEQRCTLGTLVRAGRRLARPGRRGSRRFLRTLADRVDGGALESHPEVLVADGLRRRGIPVVAQHDDLVLPSGARIRLDLAVPEIRWGIEVDVHPDHLLLAGTTDDKRRHRQCHLIRWQVDRVTTLDLLDLEGTCDELALIYDARVQAVA